MASVPLKMSYTHDEHAARGSVTLSASVRCPRRRRAHPARRRHHRRLHRVTRSEGPVTPCRRVHPRSGQWCGTACQVAGAWSVGFVLGASKRSFGAPFAVEAGGGVLTSGWSARSAARTNDLDVGWRLLRVSPYRLRWWTWLGSATCRDVMDRGTATMVFASCDRNASMRRWVPQNSRASVPPMLVVVGLPAGIGSAAAVSRRGRART